MKATITEKHNETARKLFTEITLGFTYHATECLGSGHENLVLCGAIMSLCNKEMETSTCKNLCQLSACRQTPKLPTGQVNKVSQQTMTFKPSFSV